MAIPSEMRREVIRRAGNRCEYCGLSQTGQEATFHIDHIIPSAEAGVTELENLALACVSCSLKKGARFLLDDLESVSGEKVRIFHPRQDSWNEHFRWHGTVVEGLTDIGRITIKALDLNRPLIVAIRSEEMHWGRFPPA